MSIIVQKFGGTSVADSKKILAAARKAIRAQKDGHQVVVVVSAMGRNTDRLVDLARQITDEPPAREMDMLLATGEQVSVALMAMAIHSLGHRAISLTGGQIGIMTDSIHTKANIRSISTERVCKALDEGNIVIAAGFQGIDEVGRHHDAGPRGSDTTAVALAAALGATCAKSTPTSTASTRPIPGSCPGPADRPDQLRRNAGDGDGRGRGDAQPVDRVRQEVPRAGPRAEQFQRQPGHHDPARAGNGGDGRSAARRWSRTRPGSACWAYRTGRAPP